MGDFPFEPLPLKGPREVHQLKCTVCGYEWDAIFPELLTGLLPKVDCVKCGVLHRLTRIAA